MAEFAVHWHIGQIQLKPGSYFGRTCGVHTCSVQLGLVENSVSTRIDGIGPTGAVVLALPLPMPHPSSFRGQRLQTHEMAIIRAGEEIASCHAGASRILTVAIQEPYADEIARSHGGASFRTLFPGEKLASVFPTGFATTRRRLLALLARNFKNDRPFADAAAANEFECQLIEACFAEIDFRPLPQTGAARQKVAKLAESHLRQHRREPLDLPLLCRELGTTPRSLQLGFHETFGLSMKSYAQALRFNGARRDLLAADPAMHSVKAVALDWGFRHMGRFATDYSKWFNECPRTTLASTSPSAQNGPFHFSDLQ